QPGQREERARRIVTLLVRVDRGDVRDGRGGESQHGARFEEPGRHRGRGTDVQSVPPPGEGSVRRERSGPALSGHRQLFEARSSCTTTETLPTMTPRTADTIAHVFALFDALYAPAWSPDCHLELTCAE